MKTWRSSTPQITEMDGDRYASLEMAQVVALGDVAQAVAHVVREGIAEGKLTVVDRRVIFTEDYADE